MKRQSDLLKKVNAAFGSRAGLARALDEECLMTVSQWFKPGRRVPAERCVQIAELSDGRISLNDLRPDVYPLHLFKTA